MGFLYKSQCLGTVEEARASFFADKPDSVLVSSTNSISVGYSWNGSAWMFQRKTTTSAGVTAQNFSVAATLPTFPSCDSSAAFTDGQTLGWGIAAAMAVAWGARLARRQLGVGV